MPARGNKRRGSDFERRVRDGLLVAGAVEVVRSADSRTKVDLVALLSEEGQVPRVLLVQCKRDGRLPSGERDAIALLARQTGCRAMLAKAGQNGRGIEMCDLGGNDDSGAS